MDRQSTKRIWCILILAGLLIPLTGCIGAMANLMYMFQGMRVKAAYDGLRKSRVAIICVSDASSYGPDTLTNAIARGLGTKLSKEVRGIKIVPQREIENWKDTNGWNEMDFVSLGEALGADRVLAVEIDSYSIHEGSTMYKGRAMMTTTVYDIENDGEIAFSQGPSEYQFPRSHGRPALSTSEQQFEAVFLMKLVESLGRNFYDAERVDSIAEDASMVQQ